MTLPRRALLAAGLLAPFAARAATFFPPWNDIAARARGGSVFFNAWAGDERTNAFIAWTGERMREYHDITVRHVRLRDTADAVARVLAEAASGRRTGGSVDMIWLNGPNFLALRQANLLLGPVLGLLPHAWLIDTAGKPSTVTDFTVPVEGYAVPWRMARIVFIYDSARIADPPRSIPAMLEWARAHAGRLTHPTVRNFLGVTFLKQALYELAPDPSVLAREATDADFEAATAPLWTWYAALRPHLWHQGRSFPESGPAQRQLMNDGEIDLMISFNPAEAAVAAANGTLPASVRPYVLTRGTIGNTSFVAIPANAANRDPALVLADFLISPEAQAHAADPRILGAGTVLALDRLPPAGRALFAALPREPQLLSEAALGRPQPEPHPSWMTRLVPAWERRFAG